MKPKIAIVGSGPAGSSLAIRLAAADFPVTLVEREKFPRHKLCGEFISPECLRHFGELGVHDDMLSAGGDRITETNFYIPSGKNVVVPSEWFGEGGFALSLSRAEMDNRLMQRARAAGVEVHEETSATGLLFDGAKVCGLKVRTNDGRFSSLSADITIDATGRAGLLGKFVQKEFHTPAARNPSRLIGFKAHLKNVSIEKGVCEIYSFRGGYGGLSYVENGAANFCFLIKAKTAREFGGKADKILEDLVFKNARAYRALKNAEPVHDWLAVAVDGFGKKDLNPVRNLFTVGDAAAFIDPFTGSGMLMALESASLLAECVSRHHASANALTAAYAAAYRQTFSRRLLVCALMRKAAFTPGLAWLLISVLGLSKKARELLARSTRPVLPVEHNKS